MRLSGLHIHPIKSCGGVTVREAVVDRRGLRHDRRWMLVDVDGRFVTQRETPALAMARLAIGTDGFTVDWTGAPSLTLPFLFDDGAWSDVTVWDDVVRARVHDAGSRWFSDRLGSAVRLVCMPEGVDRPVSPRRGRAGDIVSFADGYPMLVVSQASLDLLNSKLAQPVEMRRFRPNLVVEGCPPHAEDGWQALRVGDVTFRLVKPCARCTLTTVDPATGVKGKEPLRTLATYRSRDGEVFFGMNAIHDAAGATLRVGDPVTVLT